MGRSYFAFECIAMHFAIMAKRKRDEQLVIRMAAPLRRELEAAAEADDRTTSEYVRRVLIQHLVDHPPLAEHRSAA